MRVLALLLPLLLAAVSHPLLAQGDTITRNPKCVQLKRIWKIEGAVRESYVGAGVGSVGDVNGDSIGDFAVFRDLPNQWQVYYGSRDTISTTPAWAMDTGNYLIAPVVGDFWGTGHRAVGFARTGVDRTILRVYDWLRIYRTDSNRLDDLPSAVWYGHDWKDTTRPSTVADVLAVDVDGDGDDELVCAMASVYGDRHGELWIYEGGPDFRVDTPSVVIRDPNLNDDFFQAYARDIDGDRRIDLMTVAQRFQQQGNSYCFYWGTGSFPAANLLPDRQLTSTGFSKFLDWIDCDGDNAADLVTPGILLWRSANGKDPRSRSWDRADADIYLKSPGGPLNAGASAGYLNSKRYEMAGGIWSPGAILFSGGPHGPDLAYDAIYYPALDSLQGRADIRGPAGDINGDGWEDAIAANYQYPSSFDNGGIAIILAGGPYIPSDDPTVGVRHIPLENKSTALSLWPNPVREELNIAWRGDLKRMPRRFEIHDMLGRLVSLGSVPDGDGAALWRCNGQPSGSYVLSIFDAAGVVLATTRFIKL